MAGTDFSTRPYSYDDIPGDIDLLNFTLTKEDLFYKVKFINIFALEAISTYVSMLSCYTLDSIHIVGQKLQFKAN